MIAEWISALFLISGSFFLFLSAFGVFRFPDLFSRMHATSKASSFGAAQMLLAVAIYFKSFSIIFVAIITIVFIFLTVPVSLHMISRAAYFLKIPMYEKTVTDEWHGKYDPKHQDS